MRKLSICLFCIVLSMSLRGQERANALYFASDYKQNTGIYMNVPDPKYFDFKKKDSNAEGDCKATFIISEQGISSAQIQASISQKLKIALTGLQLKGINYLLFKNEFLGASRQVSSNRLSSTIEVRRKISIAFKGANKLQIIIDSFLMSDLLIEFQEIN